MKRKLFALVCVTLTAAVTAASAGAAAKERVVVDDFVEDYAFAVDCGEFGPYAFDNLVEGTARIRATEVLDRDGEVLQLVVRTVFHETNTSSVSGKSLRVHSAVTEIWDFGTNTRTLNGAVFLASDRGRPLVVHDTGRITITLDTREALFVAGPHTAFFAGGVDYPICAALAG